MEKRVIISVIFIFAFFLLHAKAEKGTFSIGGIKIESPTQNEIVVEEESYLINEDDLFRCTYKIRNKGKKGSAHFSLGITTENQEQGVNYCETLIPENFSILIDNKNSDFLYKNENTVLNSQDIFKRGIYEHDTTGDIVFSLEMKPNELKIIEIYYSINPQGSYAVNFAQNIKHSSGYKRKVSIVNTDETFFITKISTWCKDSYGWHENKFLDLHQDYVDCADIEFERRNDELVLNFVNFEPTNIRVYISVFMESPYSDYNMYSGSVVFQADESIFYKETEISKLNLFFLNKKQLRLLRNAFFALHGYTFKNPELAEVYMENLAEYPELIKKGFDEKSFNETERKNIELIREMESMTEPLSLSDYLK